MQSTLNTEMETQLKQIAVRLAAAFSLAYLLAGFLHGVLAVLFVALHSSDVGALFGDVGLFLSFVGSETLEAPFSGGFLKDTVGEGGHATYINLYPFIAPIFIVFYFVFSRGWRWLRFPD